MTATTSTEFAILGLLTLKPMSGYEMRRLIGESIGHFWGESYGQLYPSLARLEKAGLVSKRKEERQKRDKHVYSILPEGEQKLREWLSSPPKPQPPRSELLLKLFFLTPQEAPIQRRHVMASRDREVEELKHFGYIAEKLRAERGGHPQLQQWLITLNFGRHQAEARVRWAEETLEILDSAAPQQTEEAKEGARR